MLYNKKRYYIEQIYTFLCLLVAFFSSMTIWYANISRYWKEWYDGTQTLVLVGLMYSLCYYFFGKLYRAFLIGLSRLRELLFTQILTLGVSDGVLFIASFVWFHNLKKLRIDLYAEIFLAQVLIVGFLAFVCNRIYAHMVQPPLIALVYGEGDYQAFLKKMRAHRRHYRIQGCYSQDMDWKELQKELEDCDSIYLYGADQRFRSRMMLYCDQKEKEIHVSVGIDDVLLLGFEISHALDTPLARDRRIPTAWYYSFMKRFFDILFSLIGICLLSPVMLVTAVCIKKYDHGPAFYRQTRLTKNGRAFSIIKFRSMIVDAEHDGAVLSAKNDSRITPVGRFIRSCRIDELPQLFNVLRGDMSFVGPRPERPSLTEEYCRTLPEFRLRMKVKAGLTGYAQVFGKYNTTPEDKLKLDLLYINQRSLITDLQIIFYTVKILFDKESAEGVDQ